MASLFASQQDLKAAIGPGHREFSMRQMSGHGTSLTAFDGRAGFNRIGEVKLELHARVI